MLRFVYRIIQLSSRKFRYHMMRMKMSRYFKTDANMRHVEHYAEHCSIGDWFVLYQMSRNMNNRFFAEFLVVLSRRVNPCPGLDADDCEFLIHTKDNGGLKNYHNKCEPDAISLHSR